MTMSAWIAAPSTGADSRRQANTVAMDIAVPHFVADLDWVPTHLLYGPGPGHCLSLTLSGNRSGCMLDVEATPCFFLAVAAQGFRNLRLCDLAARRAEEPLRHRSVPRCGLLSGAGRTLARIRLLRLPCFPAPCCPLELPVHCLSNGQLALP